MKEKFFKIFAVFKKSQLKFVPVTFPDYSQNTRSWQSRSKEEVLKSQI